MNKEEINEMYELNEKAKTMDRLGNEDKALEAYLEILGKYQPHVFSNFERPAIILEKKRRYIEALEICKKALKLIEEEKISGDKEKCQSRIKKLESKISPEELNKNIAKNDKAKFNYKIIFGVIIFIAIIASLIISSSKSKYEDIYVDVSKIDRESELEGSMFKEAEEVELPEVTAEMVELASSSITIKANVLNANIAIDGDTLGFAIFVKEGTNKNDCENYGDDFVKSLGTVSSLKNPELLPSTPISYGEIYDYYDIIISVGVDSENIIAKGTKLKKSKKINWRK